MREQQPSTLSRSARLNQRAVETSPSSQKDALINKKIDTHPLKSAEQNVRLQVLNAIDQVENSKAMVQLYQSTGLLLDERGIAVRSVLRLTGGAPNSPCLKSGFYGKAALAEFRLHRRRYNEPPAGV